MFDRQQARAMGNAFEAALLGMGNQKAIGLKAPVGAPATTGWVHGVGGFFGVAGLEPDVISLRITPRGISSVLPVQPSVYAFPEFAYVTGIEDEGDSEPSTHCATCPSAVMQGCIQSACFGRICRESRELTTSRAIERLNRGDIDLTLANDMLGPNSFTIMQQDQRQLLNVVKTQAAIEMLVSMQQSHARMIWQGNPANNVGTGYMEYNGLGSLISTGKADYRTGTACPALDSDVKEFNYQDIAALDAQGNFRIVRMLEYLEAYLFHNASRQNLTPATWAICMRPELWYELSMIWPVAWMSTRGIAAWPTTNISYNIDGTRVREMTEAMQMGMYIMINGRRHPVIVDDGILEYNNVNDGNLNPGEYASDIYMLPITYLGSRPGTYFRHKDYRGNILQLNPNVQYEWETMNGRFLWTTERQKFCHTMSVQVEPSIVLKVPQLAGRVNKIKYTPEQHFREPWDDAQYFFKGGVSARTMSRVYPEHAKVTGVIPTDGHCQPYSD